MAYISLLVHFTIVQRSFIVSQYHFIEISPFVLKIYF